MPDLLLNLIYQNVFWNFRPLGTVGELLYFDLAACPSVHNFPWPV
jgi:hypothetical protein